MPMKEILSSLGRLRKSWGGKVRDTEREIFHKGGKVRGEREREIFSKNLLDMVNDLVKPFRTEEEMIDYVKNLRLQLEGVL